MRSNDRRERERGRERERERERQSCLRRYSTHVISVVCVNQSEADTRRVRGQRERERERELIEKFSQ